VKLAARAFYDDITTKGDNQPKTGRSDNRGIAVVVLDALTRFAASFKIVESTFFLFLFVFGSTRIEAVDFLFLLNLQTAMGKRRRFGEGLEVALEAASSNSAIFRGRKISYTRS
jgi:hypothetical protein